MSPSPLREALLVTDRVFVRPYDGSAATYAAWLLALKRLGYAVTVVSFNQARLRWTEADLARLADQASRVLILDAHPSLAAAALSKVESVAWRALAGRRYPPRLVGRRHVAENAARLARFVGAHRFDVVAVHKVSSVRLLGGVLDALAAHKVIDMHDNAPRRARLFRSAALRLLPTYPLVSRLLRVEEVGDVLCWASEARMMREEAGQVRGFDAVLFPAEEEARAFAAAGIGPATVRALPVPGPVDLTPTAGRTGEFHLGFVGADDLFNFEAVAFLIRQVLPRLLRAHPGLRVLIAGGTARSAARPLRDDGVTFVPWIERIGNFYRQVQVVAVPLLSGTGASVKTIEAAAYASAIVATAVGVRGLSLQHGQDVLVADTGESFAAAVSSLLGDPSLRARLGAGAAARVAARHSLDAFVGEIGALLPVNAAP
jgi:glycosyltransferase involved in cell wall biosynthesis